MKDVRVDGVRWTHVARLTCGCPMNCVNAPTVGWWFACPRHSDVVGYDPDDGEPWYDRDQQVVEVVEVDR